MDNNIDGKRKTIISNIGNRNKIPEINEDTAKKFAEILLEEKENWDIQRRHEKLKKILTLLAKGVALYLILAAPGSARLFRGFKKNNSEWKEWKFFNEVYLQRSIKRLESQKLVEISNENGKDIVKITQYGLQKVYKYSLINMSIIMPNYWDHKWRLVFYDVNDRRKWIRDRFHHILKNMGFYQLQESVYLHAYPCEKEVDFLRSYFGISAEVRLAIVDTIENDGVFRDFFGV